LESARRILLRDKILQLPPPLGIGHPECSPKDAWNALLAPIINRKVVPVGVVRLIPNVRFNLACVKGTRKPVKLVTTCEPHVSKDWRLLRQLPLSAEPFFTRPISQRI
jgi:hypothetical protein